MLKKQPHPLDLIQKECSHKGETPLRFSRKELLDPELGIPPRKLPRFLRYFLRTFVLPFVILDTWAQKAVRVFLKTPYRQEGACKKRGYCCHHLLAAKSETWLDRLQDFWNTQVNGFYFRDFEYEDSQKELWRVMSCRYLKKNGLCGNYFFRPSICRQWPRIEVFSRPQVMKGCGYRAVKRKIKR